MRSSFFSFRSSPSRDCGDPAAYSTARPPSCHRRDMNSASQFSKVSRSASGTNSLNSADCPWSSCSWTYEIHPDVQWPATLPMNSTSVAKKKERRTRGDFRCSFGLVLIGPPMLMVIDELTVHLLYSGLVAKTAPPSMLQLAKPAVGDAGDSTHRLSCSAHPIPTSAPASNRPIVAR